MMLPVNAKALIISHFSSGSVRGGLLESKKGILGYILESPPFLEENLYYLNEVLTSR